MRVKDKIEEKFNSKFEELIYIKPGTNITEEQYNKARERMDVWKYFNPKTGTLSILDDVNYGEEIKSNPESAQLTLEKMQKVIL